MIPVDFRDRYRRIVGRYGADALAACEDGACHGCFTSVTTQMINDLINEDVAELLPQLRPPALPDRARDRQYAAYREVVRRSRHRARVGSAGSRTNDVDSVFAPPYNAS